MIKHFLSLEWKQFFRSASFSKNVIMKFFLAFFALYIISIFLSLGFFGYKILTKKFPEQDPFVLVNQYMIFMVIGDLIMRYLMQKLPVIDIKPMLILPIKKSKLVKYILNKSIFSFFNSGALLMYTPFAIVLLMNGFDKIGVVAWLFFIYMLTLCLNFINFLINKNNKALAIMVGVLGGLWLVNRYNVFDVTGAFGKLFYAVYENPWIAITSVLPVIGLYFANFKELSNRLFLDDAVKTKAEEVSSMNLSFVDRLGGVAPFIKNDIRLIWRNKRTKMMFFMSFFFMLIGVIFFSVDAYKDKEIWQIYSAVFITGGFTLNYGQFVPAWDSEHYRMLMTQNLSYRKFLESKWYLMTVMTIILFVLATPYLYFGLDKYLLVVAGFFFNIGFSSMVMLYFGAFNKKRIELTASGLTNTQGTSAAQFIVMIPIMLLPTLVYALVNKFLGFNIAIISIAMIGIITFLLKNPLMNLIEKKYQQNKYATLQGFKQKDN